MTDFQVYAEAAKRRGIGVMAERMRSRDVWRSLALPVTEFVQQEFGILPIEGASWFGEHSIVFGGMDKRSGRRVAIKHLTNAGTFIPSVLERWFAEKSKAMLKLSRFPHPNLVEAHNYACIPEHESAVLIMDFGGASSLQDAFPFLVRGDWHNEKLIDTFMHVCRALDLAHLHDVVHGDLKPSNILSEDPWMCTAKPVIRVSDFGLPVPVSCSYREEIGDSALAFVDSWYISPEQQQELIVDSRSDIYALGCIMFEAYSGYMLPQIFEPEKVPALPVGHPDFWPPSDPGFGEMIIKASARDPEKRYQRISEMLNDLESLKNELKSKATGNGKASRPRKHFGISVQLDAISKDNKHVSTRASQKLPSIVQYLPMLVGLTPIAVGVAGVAAAISLALIAVLTHNSFGAILSNTL